MTDAYILDLPTLEQWLWGAVCTIRGPIDAAKYKDYILRLREADRALWTVLKDLGLGGDHAV